MTSTEFSELMDLASACKRLGMRKFKRGDLEFEFFTAEPLASAPEPVAESPRDVKPGRDGLTPEQQMDLYGRVLDAEG